MLIIYKNTVIKGQFILLKNELSQMGTTAYLDIKAYDSINKFMVRQIAKFINLAYINFEY